MKITNIFEIGDLSRQSEIRNSHPAGIQFSEATINSVARDLRATIDRLQQSNHRLQPREIDEFIEDMFDQLRMEAIDRARD